MRKIIFLFSILVVVAVLAMTGTGCSAASKKDFHLQKANQYFEAGQYDQAEVEYLHVLKLDRENFQAISRLGDIYFDQGRVQRAVPFIFEGHRLATNDLDMSLKLGIIDLSIGKVKEARSLAVFVLDREPKNDQAAQLFLQTAMTPQAVEETKRHLQMLAQKGDSAALQVALGNIALRAGDLKSAEAAFKRAQTLDPKSSSAWSSLGVWYLAQTNLTQAESAFKTAAELAPDRSLGKLQYASFKAEHGDPATAKSLLQEIVQKTPDFLPAWMALAEIAANAQKYDDCADILHKVLVRDPDNFDALLASARLELAQRKIAEATKGLERLASIYPQAPQAHYLLAIAYIAGNETNEAVASLTRAVALNTNFTEASFLLDGLQLKSGKVDLAVDSLKQLVRQYPQSPQFRMMLAGAYCAQGNFSEALTIYRGLETVYPTNSEIPTQIGLTLVQQKNNAEARREFEKALKLAPDNLTALENIVNLDVTEKQYAAALQQVQPTLKKFPTNATPHILQAQIFMASGDTNQAKVALLKAIELQPDIEISHMLLGRFYMDARQNQKALTEFQIAAANNTNDIGPLLMMGIIYNSQTNYNDARDAYEKLLAINPNFSPALNNLAYIYSEYLDNLDRAYELAQRARDLQLAQRTRDLQPDPSTADTLGWILCKRGQYASALALLQESGSQLPNEPEAQYHLGKVNYLMGNAGPASQAFQRALQSGKDFRGREDCANCLAVLAVDVKTAGAETTASLEKRVVAQPDDIIASLRLAAIYQRDGAIDKAAGAYETALKAAPQNVTALVNLARLYSVNSSNISRAVDLARAAYKLAPDNVEVAKTYGRLAFATGNYNLSFSLLQPIASNESKNPQLQFDFARAAYAMGRVADAQNAMQTALQSDVPFSGTNEARRFLNLTALLENPSSAMAASAQVSDVLKSEPDYVPALMILAGISAQKNDFNTAKQTYLKILNQYPDFAPAQRLLAIVCAENAYSDAQVYGIATKARTAFPTDPEVAKALGIILYINQDYARAERLLKESAAASNPNPEILYYLGMAQYNEKKPLECKKNLQQALNLNLPAKLNLEAKRVLAELK